MCKWSEDRIMEKWHNHTVVQSLSHIQLFATPWTAAHQAYLDLAQTHVHWVGDAIQSSHPLSSPSPPAFSLSQHQGLFQWVSSLCQVAKVLEFQLQQSVLPLNILGWFSLGLTGFISLHSKGFSIVFCNTTILSKYRHWEIWLLSPLMLMFQREDSQVLKIFLVSEN